jgi:hypothetical protein
MPENVAGAAPLPHIPIDGWKDAAQYAFPKTKRNPRERRANYHAHAEGLLQQLAEALGAIPAPGADDRIPVAGLKRGVLVEIETMPPTPQAKATKIPQGFDFTAQQIAVLHSERGDDRTERAIVFVPDDAREFLTQRIGAYGEQNLGNRERPDVEKFEVVEAFRQASAASLVVGAADLASADGQWWELWLRRPDAIADAVTAAAQAMNLDRLTFPDTIVVFVSAAAPALLQLVARLNGAISEVRPASRNIAPLLEVGEHGLGQHALVDDYLERITPPPEGAPTICILDTGVAAAHPLVAPALIGAWAVTGAARRIRYVGCRPARSRAVRQT